MNLKSNVRVYTKKMKGFTLIELLVVVAIIALLISILIPSLGKARKQAAGAVCGVGLQQIMLALRTYQDEHQGWLPESVNPGTPFGDMVGSLWSEAAWYVPKKNLWFYKLTPKYTANPNVFICPGDPFKARFDYEKSTQPGGEPRTDSKAYACGYGLNYILRGQPLMNTDRFGSKSLSRTILLAEVGPDDESPAPEALTAAGSGDSGVGMAWRDGGRIVWDDGRNRGWFFQPTWLTARHVNGINMSAMDGHIQRVNTMKQLKYPFKRVYNRDATFGDCYGLMLPSREYVCYECSRGATGSTDATHYTFAQQMLWWFIGDPVKIMGL
jgi:prepilin-type N-terminal cleavage/methylation domain-containing protein